MGRARVCLQRMQLQYPARHGTSQYTTRTAGRARHGAGDGALERIREPALRRSDAAILGLELKTCHARPFGRRPYANLRHPHSPVPVCADAAASRIKRVRPSIPTARVLERPYTSMHDPSTLRLTMGSGAGPKSSAWK